VKTSILVQRRQIACARYFAGYTTKGQAFPKKELQKCVGKMLDIRKVFQEGQFDEKKRSRRVVSRMITDLECNAVSRGAVELYNLASGMTPGDALAAESLQTFVSLSIDARSWVHYLEQVHSGVRKLQRSVVFGKMDVKKQLHRWSRPCWFIVYGYRPAGYPLGFLSGIEFIRHWDVVPVLPPDDMSNEGIKGVWKPNGQLAKLEAIKNGLKIILKPGLHYTVPETLEVSRISESKTHCLLFFDYIVTCV